MKGNGLGPRPPRCQTMTADKDTNSESENSDSRSSDQGTARDEHDAARALRETQRAAAHRQNPDWYVRRQVTSAVDDQLQAVENAADRASAAILLDGDPEPAFNELEASVEALLEDIIEYSRGLDLTELDASSVTVKIEEN